MLCRVGGKKMYVPDVWHDNRTPLTVFSWRDLVTLMLSPQNYSACTSNVSSTFELCHDFLVLGLQAVFYLCDFLTSTMTWPFDLDSNLIGCDLDLGYDVLLWLWPFELDHYLFSCDHDLWPLPWPFDVDHDLFGCNRDLLTLAGGLLIFDVSIAQLHIC